MATARYYIATDFRTFDLHARLVAADRQTIQAGTPGSWTLRDNILVGDPFEYVESGYVGTNITRVAGTLTGGTFTRLTDYHARGTADMSAIAITSKVTDVSISAVAWQQAHRSVARDDDLALLRAAFAGNDSMVGSDGADYFWSAAGADTVSGGAGNDTLFGQTGADRMYGGLGHDRLLGGDQGDLVSGHDGNDRLFGEAGADSLYGGTGADQLDGGNANDTVMGNDGNDVLLGGLGADLLGGGAGNDTLEGGGGNDSLYLGLGVDRIVLRAGFGTDRVTGFTPGEDRFLVHVPDGSSTDINVHYAGGDATVTLLDGQLLIEDVAVNSITLADFLLIPE